MFEPLSGVLTRANGTRRPVANAECHLGVTSRTSASGSDATMFKPPFWPAEYARRIGSIPISEISPLTLPHRGVYWYQANGYQVTSPQGKEVTTCHRQRCWSGTR